MSKETENPQAFPGFYSENDDSLPNGINRHYLEGYQGMTLRDYFAAKAMQGLTSDREAMVKLFEKHGENMEKYVAEMAYDRADAMLKERSKS